VGHIDDLELRNKKSVRDCLSPRVVSCLASTGICLITGRQGCACNAQFGSSEKLVRKWHCLHWGGVLTEPRGDGNKS
jgi:hypothetical protein